MANIYSIILAAGKGTRMNSELPKVLHKVMGKELVKHVVEQANILGVDQNFIVIGYKSELVKETLIHEKNVKFVIQKEQKGTGHAVLMAKPEFENLQGDIIILCGDVPALRANTLDNMYQFHKDNQAQATVLTAILEDPLTYGRIVKDEKNKFLKIVEHKDATEDQKKIKEINSGVYILDSKLLFNALEKIKSNNAQGEYYLTDVVEILADSNHKVLTYTIQNPQEITGVNTQEQLLNIEQIMKTRI